MALEKALCLDAGRLIFEGMPKEIKTNPQILEAYLEV